jgi:hypothetical protein
MSADQNLLPFCKLLHLIITSEFLIILFPLSVQMELFTGTRSSKKQHLVDCSEMLLQLIMMLWILGLTFWF